MATPAELAALAMGVQPVEGARMICRYCGKSYLKLSQHLRMTHDCDPDTYRAEFELPDSLALMAAHLREAIGQRSRHRLQTDARARAAFDLDSPSFAERQRRSARGRERAQQTAARAGVQLSWQANGVQAGAHSKNRAERRRSERDGLARARGYQHFADLLNATTDQSAGTLAASLNMSAATIERLRSQHQIKSQSRSARIHAAAAERAARLNAVPAGTQPCDEKGRLLCLQPGCGRVFSNLHQHLDATHRLTDSQYRTQHHLPADTTLISDALRRHRTDSSAANSKRAAAASAASKSAATRRRYDDQARQLQFTDIEDLLTALPDNGHAAAVLHLSHTQVWRLRRRYCPPGS